MMDMEVATGSSAAAAKTCPSWGQESKQSDLGEEKELRRKGRVFSLSLSPVPILNVCF